jgi:hypothetical protein
VTIKKGASKGKYKIVEVKATIENKGKLATHVARGAQLRGNRDDVVWLIGNRDKTKFLQGGPWQRLGVLDGQMRIPGLEAGPRGGPQRGGTGGGPTGPGGPPTIVPQLPSGMPGMPMGQRGMGARGQEQPQQTGPRREVKWLVAVEGDAPLTVIATSQKGGTVAKEIAVR